MKEDFFKTALSSICWLSVNWRQELFGKYPNHFGITVALWPPLQEIPLLARKFHTALTLLRKERRKEGGNVAVCSVFMEYLWEFGFKRANLCRTILHGPPCMTKYRQFY